MSRRDTRRRILGWSVAGLGGLALGYGALAAWSWARFGHARPPSPEQADEWLEQFMPQYDVAERHHIRVDAPADTTLAAACAVNFGDSLLIGAIVRTRELVLGTATPPTSRPVGLLAEMTALGWGTLANTPHEIVMGAVTQPWQANVVFRAIPPAAFRDFSEPGFVKIVWTLRADAVDRARSIFRTETRAVATDPASQRRFRWYWARFSAGIALIRSAALRLVTREAERRASRSA